MEEGEIKVRVRTPSRLHFGIVDMRGDLGRLHGSFGVAIDDPHLLLEAEKDSELKIYGTRTGRIKKYSEIILKEYGIKGGVRIEVKSDIPEHKGYGSGTQLALAIGTAISELYDLKLSPNEIARKLDRSKVSGIGTYAFQKGGFLVDGGHDIEDLDTVPPLIFRSNVPNDWLFVIGVPEINSSKNGDNEKKAFKELEPPPNELIQEVSHIVLMQMIPSIIEGDINKFGQAITQLDYKFGGYWLKVQGGRYTHPVIEDGVNFLLDSGSFGAGQSSWGPVFYGLVKGLNHGREMTRRLSEYFNNEGIECEVFLTKPNNKGAQVVKL